MLKTYHESIFAPRPQVALRHGAARLQLSQALGRRTLDRNASPAIHQAGRLDDMHTPRRFHG